MQLAVDAGGAASSAQAGRPQPSAAGSSTQGTAPPVTGTAQGKQPHPASARQHCSAGGAPEVSGSSAAPRILNSAAFAP